MILNSQSTPGDVLMHHPRRDHYDSLVLDPSRTWFKNAGPWRYVLSAQDNVLLRRHIREQSPDVAAILNLRELDAAQLAATINRLRLES